MSELGKIVAIVQARSGSKRLPGKMLEDLCGYPVIHWVLHRVKSAALIDKVVLATSDKEEDKKLIKISDKLEIDHFVGDEHDVLARFQGAAEKYKAEIIIRICADNPLVSPEELDKLIIKYISLIKEGKDINSLFVYNNIPDDTNSYPDGLGGQIFSANILKQSYENSTLQNHREHVDEYIFDNPDYYEIISFPADKDIAYPNLKFDIDTKEDLAYMRRLCRGLSLDSANNPIINNALRLAT